MDLLTQARSIMAMSLSFHIVFASISMTMPLLMVLAEYRWLKSGRLTDLVFKRWQTATAILFAAGALSGTILAFELGMFWPEFMRRAGPIVAVPFSMESFAFFIEAIFLALYTYGWRKLPPWFHFICGCIVVLSSWGSAAFITAVNGWMNTPQGFELLVDGEWLLKVENFRDLAALSPAMENHAAESLPLGSHLKSILQIPSRPRYPGFLGSGLVLTRLDSCVDGFTRNTHRVSHPCTSNCSTCSHHHQYFPSCDGRSRG